MLEEQQEGESRKRHRATWASLAAVLLVLVGSVSGWFIQSPQRDQAFDDVRSADDAAFSSEEKAIGTSSQDGASNDDMLAMSGERKN